MVAGPVEQPVEVLLPGVEVARAQAGKVRVHSSPRTRPAGRRAICSGKAVVVAVTTGIIRRS
ncbi:hypothetical protein GCM10010199_21890 [Dactylosporangium roseum]